MDIFREFLIVACVRDRELARVFAVRQFLGRMRPNSAETELIRRELGSSRRAPTLGACLSGKKSYEEWIDVLSDEPLICTPELQTSVMDRAEREVRGSIGQHPVEIATSRRGVKICGQRFAHADRLSPIETFEYCNGICGPLGAWIEWYEGKNPPGRCEPDFGRATIKVCDIRGIRLIGRGAATLYGFTESHSSYMLDMHKRGLRVKYHVARAVLSVKHCVPFTVPEDYSYSLLAYLRGEVLLMSESRNDRAWAALEPAEIVRALDKIAPGILVPRAQFVLLAVHLSRRGIWFAAEKIWQLHFADVLDALR